MKIITDFTLQPSPIRDFDWRARTDSYEPGDPIGYGATEEAGIADLKSLLEELRPEEVAS